MKMFSSFAKAAALAAVLIAAPAAFASDKIDLTLQEKVTAQLTGQGYDVRKIKKEGGQLEAYVVKDGKAVVLILDDKLNIVKTEDENSEGAEGSEGSEG